MYSDIQIETGSYPTVPVCGSGNPLETSWSKPWKQHTFPPWRELLIELVLPLKTTIGFSTATTKITKNFNMMNQSLFCWKCWIDRNSTRYSPPQQEDLPSHPSVNSLIPSQKKPAIFLVPFKSCQISQTALHSLETLSLVSWSGDLSFDFECDTLEFAQPFSL